MGRTAESRVTLRIASVGVAVVAFVLLARMAVFMVDAEQTQLSIQPGDPFRTAHSCLSAYAEAARFAAEPDRNVYEPSLYENRKISNLKVDTYHYPPPFLLLPGAMQRVTGDFVGLRAPWFVVQLGLLVFACWLVGRWLGGREGRGVWLASPLLFIAPATLFTVQMGNFQSTAFALSIIGMIALSSARVHVQALGGLALAYASISKVFPGVLVVYLVIMRRWRAVAWTAAAGIVLMLLAITVYGTRPLEDFIHYQLPRLSSGEAFPQSELPRLAASNMSFYGLLVKLRTLGLDAIDIKTGLAINSVYGLAVIALAIAVIWRRRSSVDEPESRLDALQLWLALTSLASYRSPFVGGAYGMLGTVWLSTIMIGAAATTRARIGWCVTFAILVAGSFIVPTPIHVPTTTRVALSAAFHVFMIGVNAWVCVTALSRPSRPMLRP
jgi:alpha-1,2-mannosyltransferase